MISKQMKEKFKIKYVELDHNKPDFINYLMSQNPSFFNSSYDGSQYLFGFGYLLVSVHPYGVEYFLAKQI